MGFGPMWRQIGDDIAPVSPAIDTLRLFSGSEYATIERAADLLKIYGGVGSNIDIGTDGEANIFTIADDEVKIKSPGLRLQNGGGDDTIKIDNTGIGVFATTPVAQQDKQADLNVGVSGLEDTQTFCNTLQERLGADGGRA